MGAEVCGQISTEGAVRENFDGLPNPLIARAQADLLQDAITYQRDRIWRL